MGLWLNEHQQGEGFGLTRILLFILLGFVGYSYLKNK